MSEREQTTCRTCKFWQINAQDLSVGECRVKHPVALPMPQQGQLGFTRLFPPTESDDWCGEWQERRR